ncbi:MAG: methyltransferase domain-containing protein [Gemmatimonadales bacterium]
MRERRRQPEIMDRLDLEGERHVYALEGLARLNAWSLSGRALWRPLARLARTSATPLRVLDLACGGGDNTIRLARRAQRTGIAMQIDACDVSDRAVRYATGQAERAGVGVHFFQTDVLSDPMPGSYDAVMSSLFLHHLDEVQAVKLLTRMSRAATRLVVIHDLVRSRAGLALAHLACRILSRSDVVRHDGPRSVESAFTISEVRTLASRAGLTSARVTRSWPQRFLLVAQPAGQTE